MENSTNEFHKVLKQHTTSFSDFNSNIDIMSHNLSTHQLNHHPLISSHALDYLSSSDGFLSHPNTALPSHLASVNAAYQSLFASFDQANAGEFAEIPSSPGFGSESGGNYVTDYKNSPSGRKRKRKTVGNNPKEVVHVRAKRGQATDSHSLAERVRRERINEKLKVLQDLVPGCYKTMGMAVMLEVIINYVRSLQNQIEFLSMKLSAASMFYDFNSPEAEAIETLQRTAIPYEAQETEILAREGLGGTLPRLHTTWPF